MGQSPENSKATTAASAVVVSLAVISVALRFYARTLVKAGVASDDWWILVGLVLTFITGGLLLYGMLRRSTCMLRNLIANSEQASSLIHMAER
jgi:hypothetical protein